MRCLILVYNIEINIGSVMPMNIYAKFHKKLLVFIVGNSEIFS